MEQESAKRSVKRHQVRYTEMLSDGDSAAFREVVALNPYPASIMPTSTLSSQGKIGGKG